MQTELESGVGWGRMRIGDNESYSKSKTGEWKINKCKDYLKPAINVQIKSHKITNYFGCVVYRIRGMLKLNQIKGRRGKKHVLEKK